MVQFEAVKSIKNAPKVEEEKAIYIVESFVLSKGVETGSSQAG